MVAASSSSQAGRVPPGTQTFQMNSDDGTGSPASDRDEPPPLPPMGAGGSSKDRRSASVDDGPPQATKSRMSAS
eukprot:9591119-Lingulodinium_polyedra.AAC.1